MRQGERIGIPVALVILVVLFGTLAAVLMPIGLSIISIIVALGIAALIGQTFDLVFFVTLMIVMIGLAVGIDYSILIISRFRDERARGGTSWRPSSAREQRRAARCCSVDLRWSLPWLGC